jgi:hypothetical protein
MRKIVSLLLLTAGMTSYAKTAMPVGVEQVEQLLAASHGQADGKVAKDLSNISNLGLTERISSVRLARWETEFPGRQCHEAFTKLADASTFLNLPAAEKPAVASPNLDTQKDLIIKALVYARATIAKLPNFYATRATEHFEDSLPSRAVESASQAGRGARGTNMAGTSTAESSYVPIHSTGITNEIVSYRDGHELVGSRKVDLAKAWKTGQGLTTSGEFGPMLIAVLEDASRSQIAWNYWEDRSRGLSAGGQDAHNLAAVFRYSVPQDQSNYAMTIPNGKQAQQLLPPYHGEITIDPASGSVLRLTVIADIPPPFDIIRNSIMVEYGSVPIGGANYTCPVKSVAYSRTPLFSAEGGVPDRFAPAQTQLNDVEFTDYHIFRSEARIVIGPDTTNDNPPAPPK